MSGSTDYARTCHSLYMPIRNRVCGCQIWDSLGHVYTHWLGVWLYRAMCDSSLSEVLTWKSTCGGWSELATARRRIAKAPGMTLYEDSVTATKAYRDAISACQAGCLFHTLPAYLTMPSPMFHSKVASDPHFVNVRYACHSSMTH